MVYVLQIEMLHAMIDDDAFDIVNRSVPTQNLVKSLQDLEILLTLANNGFIEYDEEIIVLTQKGFEVLNS